jgi:hypothetical protein
VQNLTFDADELAAIDEHAVESGINLWKPSSDVGLGPRPGGVPA